MQNGDAGVLSGRKAIVTGSAQNIGKAIALTLAGMGADIAVVDVDIEKAEETAGEIEALGRRSIAMKVNVVSASAVNECVEKTVEKLGGIDILVNNAGITRDALLLRMKEEDWDLVIAVNLKGTYNFTKAVARPMVKAKSGCIVNVASVIGVMGNVGQANYAASKAGIIGLTKASAKEFASRGIRVNAVAPGFIKTAMTDAMTEKARASLMEMIPLRRLGTSQNVADVIGFLVSPAADYMTGQVFRIDGGMIMA